VEDGDADEPQSEPIELSRTIDLRMEWGTLLERATGPECAQSGGKEMMQWVNRREGRRAQENGPESELRGHRPARQHEEEGPLPRHDAEDQGGRADAGRMLRAHTGDERGDDEDDADDIDHRRRPTAEPDRSFLREDAENAAHDVLRDAERMMAFEVLVALFAEPIAEALVTHDALDALGEAGRIVRDERFFAVLER
jgi:hypothetical protein